ncbi:helix-turn-helix domain-containing protein [Serratia sp. L9]|uniref:helix-turn-helix domain-containing protein n=1 Tax=Serratia sp. L9 TaxID=3423946 RepID=UPI003D66F835
MPLYITVNPRETEVLQCLATGMCVQDTADYLAISNKTVNAHKRSAMHKLHFRRNQELHKWFLQGGAVSLAQRPEKKGTEVKHAVNSTADRVLR